jgi:hypothetical protein
LRISAREHVLYCDGSLKGLAMPIVRAKMPRCKILSAAAAFVIHFDVMEISKGEPFPNSV